MSKPDLEKISKELTLRHLNTPGCEGFGFHPPDTLVVYVRNRRSMASIRQLASQSIPSGVKLEMRVVGRTLLHA